MSVQDNAKMIRSMYDMFNSRDFEGMAAQAAANVELRNMALCVTLHGPEGVRQYAQGWATGFPDSRVEVTNVIASDEGAVVEFRGKGTHTGPLIGPAGEIPATGRSVDVAFCEVYQIKEGKITSLHSYFDAATMMGQLGLMG